MGRDEKKKRKRKGSDRDDDEEDSGADYDDDDERRRRHRHRRHDRDRDRGDHSDSRDKKSHKHRHKRDDRKERKDDEEDEDSRSRSDDERRKKKKKRRRHDENISDSDSDSDEHNSRSHKKKIKKRKDDKKKKSSSSSKHSSRKDKKRSKDSRKDKSDEDGPKINPPDRSTLIAMGEKYGQQPDPKLDCEKDYFSFHQQFWVYLYREEGIAFNDLDSKQAHVAFKRFVKRYNAGDLEVPYYEGLPNDVIEEGRTTKHSWNFKTSEKEREGLETLQAGIRKQTEYKDNNNTSSTTNSAVGINRPRQPMVQSRPSNDNRDERHRMTPEERREQRREDRKLKEWVQVANEELTGIGKHDYRDRQLEKKRQQSDRMHGASRDKREGEVLNDDAIYGDRDQASFRSALDREKRRTEKKQEHRQNRIEELKTKEEERKKNMLKMLGLEGVKEKIKIAPRKDA